MRLLWLLPFLTACEGILGIPSEGKIGCPEPCTVSITGHAVRAESTATPQQALSSAVVKLTSVMPAQSMTTGADGTFSFTGLQPNTIAQFDVSIPQTNPDPQGLLDTRYMAGNTTTNDLVVDVPVVQIRWLAQVTVDCGIFPDLNTALFAAGSTNVNSFFQTRSTVIGQVLNMDGTAAALDRADITVVLNNYLNYNGNPSDTTNPPGSTVCLLEPDLNNGVFRGSNEAHTTSGRFVLFRARNDLGTGTGIGEVRIPGFPTASLNVSSASIGFAKIQLGQGTALPPRLHTFERDVYHYFAEKGCTTCHTPGGVGYMDAPKRMGRDGIIYPADWSGTVDQVFNALTQPAEDGCDTSSPAARVCLVKPEASLVYANPAGIAMPTHPGIILPSDDPMLADVLQWVKDGATER